MTDSTSKTIRDIRITRGLSQEQTAKDLSVSVNYISLIENNKKKPGMSFLKKFSAKYNVPLLLLTKEVIIPQAKTPKERELRSKVIELISDLEQAFLRT